MKKFIIIIGIFCAGILAFLAYRYYMQPSYYDLQDAADMAVFFTYAQNELPQKLSQEIENLKKEKPINQNLINQLEKDQQALHIINLISNRDIEALKNSNPQEFNFDFEMRVDGNRFKNTFDGKLASRMLGGTNALAFVLFHSAMDKSKQDQNKTLAMLKLILDKKISPNAIGAEVYWVKDDPKSEKAFDYISQYLLPTIAVLYSFPKALELLLQYGATFKGITGISASFDEMKKRNPRKVQEFEKIFAQYKAQTE